MRTAFCVNALIRQPKPFHWPSVDQVLLDNLSGIFGAHVPVPDGFWIDHNRRSMLALIETARLVDPHGIPQASGLRKLLQLCVQFALAVARARGSGRALWTGIMADEDVMLENWQICTSCSRLQVRRPFLGGSQAFHISPRTATRI